MKKQSSITVEGVQLLLEIKRAVTEASLLQSICKITHKKEKAVIVSAMWIPLITKLVCGTFKKSEIDNLRQRLSSAKTTKDASRILASWAEELM